MYENMSVSYPMRSPLRIRSNIVISKYCTGCVEMFTPKQPGSIRVDKKSRRSNPSCPIFIKTHDIKTDKTLLTHSIGILKDSL